MSGWRWELVRARDGQRVDRATKLWILQKASVPVIVDLGFSKGHVYHARHLETGRVVAKLGELKTWETDLELLAELEPDEVPGVLV